MTDDSAHDNTFPEMNPRKLRMEHDRDAIAEGIAQMEAGEAIPADQAFAEVRSQLGFPARDSFKKDGNR